MALRNKNSSNQTTNRTWLLPVPFPDFAPRQRHFLFPPETGKVCGEADILEWGRTKTEALGERAPWNRPLLTRPAWWQQAHPMAWLYPQVLVGKRQLLLAKEISDFAHYSQRPLINLLHAHVWSYEQAGECWPLEDIFTMTHFLWH